MSQTSQSAVVSEDMYLSDIVSGAHGDQYQKDLAKMIFERATRKGYDFQLAYEMAIADKFDDVAFFNRDKNEWILIQTKHSDTSKGTVQPLKFDMLFPTDEATRDKSDFSLFKYLKSYITIQANIKERKSIIIFTNRDLSNHLDKFEQLIEIEVRKVDDIVHVENSRHIGLKVKHQLKMEMLDYVNREFNSLKNGIVKLFNEGIIDQTVTNFKTPVADLFIVTNTSVKFSETYSSQTKQMFMSLSGVMDIQTAQLPLGKCKNLFTGKSRNKTLPLFTDENTVEQFFQDLILSVRQPDNLHDIIDQDLRSWMRTWIRPTCLQRQEEPLLAISSGSLEKTFNEKNLHVQKPNDKNCYKFFLKLSDAEEFFRCIEKDFRHSLTYSLSSEFYISRQLEYDALLPTYNTDKMINSDIRHKKKFSTQNPNKTFLKDILQIGSTIKKTIRDDKFVDELFKIFEKQQILLITAEPGMGKSTILEFIALTAQQKSSHCVYHFYLNTFNNDLLQINETDSFDKLLSVLGKALSETNINYIRNVIVGQGNNRKHLIIFDGFDEIYPQNRKKVFKIFNAIRNVPNIKMLISTRRTVQILLEDKFVVKTFSLAAFSDKDQHNFLRLFWKVSEENERKFRTYVRHLFKIYHTDINQALLECTGIPLMLKMLAEVYGDHFKEYLKREPNSSQELLPQNVFSVINLYEQFFEKCFANKMLKKCRTLSEDIDEEFEPLFRRFTLEHQLLAIKHLQIKSLEVVHEKDKYIKILHEFEERILNGTEKSPLIEVVDKDIRFIHLSYAEFLTAKFLFRKIENYKVATNLFAGYSMVRIFFFTLIETRNKTKHLETLRRHYQQNTRIILWACEARGQKVVEFLLQVKREPTIINQLLGVTAEHNCFKICKNLLENYQGIINCTFRVRTEVIKKRFHLVIDKYNNNAFECTTLHIAAGNGHSEVLKILLDHIGNVDAKAIDDVTPLHCAVLNGHSEVVKILTDHSANVDAKATHDATPLHCAAELGRPDVVKILIDQCGNVNAKMKDSLDHCFGGWTPLHVAAEKGHLEVVEILIDHSGDVHAKTNAGETPLHFAAGSGHLEVVKILIDNSGDVHAKTNAGSTPLYLAAGSGHVEVVKILIENPDVNAKTSDDWTPLHTAAQRGKLAIVKILIDNSGDVHAKTNAGSTPLYLAAGNGRLEVVKMLIDHYGDVHGTAVDDWTPLRYAMHMGHLKVVKILLEYFGKVHAKTNAGSTPLYLYAGIGRLEVVKILIDHFEDVHATKIDCFTPFNFADQTGCSRILNLIEHCGNYQAKEIDDWTPLHLAAEKGHLEVVKTLIDHSGDVNAKQVKGWTPLHFAAQKGHSKVVRILIDHCGDVQAKSNKGMTPLYLAAENGRLEVVKMLIDHFGDVDSKLLNSWTPLHIAAQNGHLDVVNTLIHRSGDVHAKTNQGSTPLLLAAEEGHLEVVKSLIDHSANVNATTDYGLTALFYAAESGHLEVVRTLINHHGHVNARSHARLTPLHFAAGNGHLEIVKLLVFYSGDVNAKDRENFTPLHCAAGSGYSEIVETLVDHRGDVNGNTNHKWTPLHFAAKNSHLEVVKVLIYFSGDVNAKDICGLSPLHFASTNGQLKLVKILIDHSADVNAQSSTGVTPLHLAVENNCFEVVKILIDHLATVNIVNHEGWTPLHVAADMGHLGVGKILIDHFSNVIAKDVDCWTPLHYAAQNGHLELAKMLIDHSGCVNMKSNKGVTPLHLAARNNHLGVLQILIDHLGKVNALTIDGSTPLHRAAEHGHLEVVKMLIDNFANANATTNRGVTPLHLAVQNNHLKVVQFLIDHAEKVNANLTDYSEISNTLNQGY